MRLQLNGLDKTLLGSLPCDSIILEPYSIRTTGDFPSEKKEKERTEKETENRKRAQQELELLL